VTHLVSYFEDCFEPNDITVNMGDTVKFKNISWMDNMWVASNNHPTHTTYPGFDAGQPFPPETFYQFTFNNPGTWGYHDHLKPSCTGSITVR
jgi:plastocyanin